MCDPLVELEMAVLGILGPFIYPPPRKSEDRSAESCCECSWHSKGTPQVAPLGPSRTDV